MLTEAKINRERSLCLDPDRKLNLTVKTSYPVGSWQFDETSMHTPGEGCKFRLFVKSGGEINQEEEKEVGSHYHPNFDYFLDNLSLKKKGDIHFTGPEFLEFVISV